MRSQKSPPLILQLLVLTLGRLCLNSGLRMVYPFLPELARGLAVPLTAATRLVSLRNFAGFVSPLLSPLSERFGRRPILAGALVLFGLGCFVVALWPAYWPLGFTLILVALAKVTYDPAMQAYLGDHVPYHQRGRAIAVTELSWAGALLVGAPVMGFIIQRQGWSAPFLWLGLAGLAVALWLWRVIPAQTGQRRHGNGLRATLQVLAHHPVIWAAVLYTLLTMIANEMLFIVYGDWMETTFQLSLTSLGLASGVIGGAEILGEITAGWSVDRFGKRPVIVVTGLLNALMYLLIPHTEASLGGALAALFALFLLFEIAVVGSVPLLTELVPGARSVVMSMNIAAAGLGRAAGSWLGPELWLRYGFPTLGLASAAVMAVAILILARWVREGGEGRDWEL
ncbi:MAG: MFS transporter [Chloroflexota bacterium]